MLTKANLGHIFDMHDHINNIFTCNDPDDITNIIVSQMDSIIESIAPKTRIQCCNRYAKWYSPKVKELGEIKNKSHSRAKQSDNQEDWRIFRQDRNNYNNASKEA